MESSVSSLGQIGAADVGLIGAFESSTYSEERYAHWPLGRRVHAFLAEQRGIEDYEAVFVAVFSRALAMRPRAVAAG